MRVAVIGVGGTGSAALRFLAQAGHQAVGFEQFQVGHDRGSSHGETRIIRYTYPDVLYTRMMADAYPLWEALQEGAGEELFVRCGGLMFGPEDNQRLADTEASLIEARLPYEKLSPNAVKDRFPAIRLHPREIGLYQKDTGFLRAGRCVRANARLAVEAGADLREKCAVQSVQPDGDTVRIQVDDAAETFDRVIVTAGAWMNRLLPTTLPLRVTRQQVVYLKIADNPDALAPGRFPVWMDAESRHYGFPADGVIPGLKMAAHAPGAVVDPDRVRRETDDDYRETMAAYGASRFEGLEPEVVSSHTCLYTNTPDEDFVLDRVEGAPVWIVSGCSGHGFKFTVLLGKIAADLATGGAYPRDLSRFSMSRFADA
jgi:sarcosine oxidase